jgi:hypothetical protein
MYATSPHLLAVLVPRTGFERAALKLLVLLSIVVAVFVFSELKFLGLFEASFQSLG